jgi:hypothetical protein
MTDELEHAVRVVLDILGRRELGVYLVQQPGRCPLCGAGAAVQGHTDECPDAGRRDESTYPTLHPAPYPPYAPRSFELPYGHARAVLRYLPAKMLEALEDDADGE